MHEGDVESMVCHIFASHKRFIVGGAALSCSYSLKKRIDSRIIMEEIS